MSASYEAGASPTGAGDHLAAIRAMNEKPSGTELADEAATELRTRIVRGDVRTKDQAKRLARTLTKRVTARRYKRGTAEYEHVREVCAEIAENFRGGKHLGRRGRRS